MDLYDIAIARKLSGGSGGGGGSSDFSTATVTVTHTSGGSNSDMSFSGVFIDGGTLIGDGIYCSVGTNTFTIVLYQGSQNIYASMQSLTSISGDITGDLDDGFVVTGDCTIVGVGNSVG